MRYGPEDIGPAAWIADIAESGDSDAWRTGEFAEGFAGMTMSYRNGWYVIHDEPETLFAMGIHGQNLFVDRVNRLVIAKVSSQNSPIDYQAVPLTRRFVAEFLRCLLGSPKASQTATLSAGAVSPRGNRATPTCPPDLSSARTVLTYARSGHSEVSRQA